MTDYRLSLSNFKADTEIILPGSKSISNRLLIIRALSGSNDTIQNLSISDDTEVLIQALSSKDNQINIGHAGTAMRFLTAFYAIQQDKQVTLSGSDRMHQRPIGELVTALQALGADIAYLDKEGYPPLQIKGKSLQGGKLSVNGNISSQYISALLMIAPYMKEGLQLTIEGNIVSDAYIQTTIDLMRMFGVCFKCKENVIIVPPSTYSFSFPFPASSFNVEGDWTNASYWYAVQFLSSQNPTPRIRCLNMNSIQGDVALIGIFDTLGIITHYNDGTGEVTLKKKDIELPASFSFDFTNNPDLVQTFAVALCAKGIPFHFTGTQTLRIKETDRIAALQTELKKFGFTLESDEQGSFLSWDGTEGTPQDNIEIDTYDDHRMAMAFAPMILSEKVDSFVIKDAGVVSKSYPNFWDEIQKVGIAIEELLFNH